VGEGLPRDSEINFTIAIAGQARSHAFLDTKKRAIPCQEIWP